jgi:Protein of unknown function (DUF2465)
LGDGLTEDDLLGGSPREPLRTCCLKLAEKLWALVYNATSWLNAAAIRLAVQEVQQSANTDAAAKENLDKALVQLIRAIDSNATTNIEVPMSRLDAVEMLAGLVQAGIMSGLGSDSGHKKMSAGNQSMEGGGEEEEEDYNTEEAMEEVDDSNTLEVSSLLQSIALLLEINPRQASGAVVAEEIQKQVEKLSSGLPSGFYNAIVPPGTLTDIQVAMLKEVDTALHAENALRRRMLIERVKVTLQSFMWSKRFNDKEESGATTDLKTAAEETIASSLEGMNDTPRISVEDVFTATLGDVMTVTERATSASGPGSIRAKVKDILIGSVPDRGGRTDGKRKVAMPEWSERKVTAGGGGMGRGRGGRGGGGGGGQKRKQRTSD